MYVPACFDEKGAHPRSRVIPRPALRQVPMVVLPSHQVSVTRSRQPDSLCSDLPRTSHTVISLRSIISYTFHIHPLLSYSHLLIIILIAALLACYPKLYYVPGSTSMPSETTI
jgi:hypothetical protein